MTPKPVPTSGRFKVTSSIVITTNLEFNSTCRRMKHSLFHWNALMLRGLLIQICGGVTRRIDDCWNVDSNRYLSDSWQGFTKFTKWKEKPPKPKMWSVERLTKVQTTTRPDHVWPVVWTKIGKADRIERNKNGKNEKPKADNARRPRGIYLLIQMMKNTRNPFKMRGKVGNTCGRGHAVQKGGSFLHQETGSGAECISQGSKPKTKYIVVWWNLMNPECNEWNPLYLKITEITLQAKVLLRWPITFWFTSLFRCRKRWKFPMQKPQWTRKGTSSRGLRHRIGKKSRAKKRLFWKHKMTERKSTFPRCRTYVTLEVRSWNQNYRSTKTESCCGGTLLKTTLELVQFLLNRARLRPRWLPQKNRCHCKITWLWRTSSWCSICLFSLKNWRMLPDCPKFPKSECPDVWIRFPRQIWPTSFANSEDPVVLLERNLYGHLLARLLWERQFEEALLALGGEKVPNWECMFVLRKQWFFLLVYVDDIKMDGKRQNMAPTWKKMMKNWTLTNPHHFLTMYIWDVLSVNANRMKPLSNNIRRGLNHVFLLEQLKHYQVGKSLAQKLWRGHTTWRDMLENASSDTVTCKQESGATLHEVSLAWMIINSSRRNSDQLENCQKFAYNLSWNACIRPELVDLTFCGL